MSPSFKHTYSCYLLEQCRSKNPQEHSWQMTPKCVESIRYRLSVYWATLHFKAKMHKHSKRDINTTHSGATNNSASSGLPCSGWQICSGWSLRRFWTTSSQEGISSAVSKVSHCTWHRGSTSISNLSQRFEGKRPANAIQTKTKLPNLSGLPLRRHDAAREFKLWESKQSQQELLSKRWRFACEQSAPTQSGFLCRFVYPVGSPRKPHKVYVTLRETW